MATVIPQTIIEKDGLFMYIPTIIHKHPKAIWLFDVDGTILTASDGALIAGSEFELLGDVFDVFQELEDRDALVALVSNQANWTTEAKMKFQRLRVLFPSVVQLIATGKSSPYRKPSKAIYDEFLKVLMEKSVSAPRTVHMVGDAIGDVAKYPPYKWSDSDLRFAEAIGAIFHEPTEIFRHTAEPEPDLGQELIIMIGNPGSGKSTLSGKFKEVGYVVASQDELGSKAKVIRIGKQAWNLGKSVIVDATNPGADKRRELVEEITADTAPTKPRVRFIWHIRDGRSFNKLRSEPVPEIAYRTYTKNFVRPTLEELESLNVDPESSIEIVF